MTDPLHDVNQQHLAAMGLSGHTLGQPVDTDPTSKTGRPFDEDRCSATNEFGLRCVLRETHDGVHIRGRLRWSGPSESVEPPRTREELVEQMSRGDSAPPTAEEIAILQAGEPTKTREGDQVLPSDVGPWQKPVQDLVIDEMQRSKAVGIARYGRPLLTWNGRKGFHDVLEEARDLHVYLTQVAEEAKADRDDLISIVAKAFHPESDGEDVATAEIAVDAIMDWVIGKRLDQGTFEDQRVLYDFLDDAWPITGGRSEIVECLTHALGEHLDIPEPDTN